MQRHISHCQSQHEAAFAEENDLSQNDLARACNTCASRMSNTYVLPAGLFVNAKVCLYEIGKPKSSRVLTEAKKAAGS